MGSAVSMSGAGLAGVGSGLAGGLANASKRRSPLRLISVILLICIVAGGVFIYPTARQHYKTSRENARLQAEYEAIQQRNAVIQAEVDALKTDAGVEDKAREEFGWVKPGENAVNIYGLETVDARQNYTKAVLSGSVPAPDTWYTPLLDLIFQV